MAKLYTAAYAIGPQRHNLILARALSMTLVLFGVNFQTAEAQNRGFARVFEAHPISKKLGPNNACHHVFAQNQFFQTVVTTMSFSDQHLENPVQARSYEEHRHPQISHLVDHVLNDWVKDRDHTPEQKDLLKRRDEQLDPRRTTYIHLETDGHPAMLRVFDGSTQVLKAGTEWRAASMSPSLTPLEIGSAGKFTLPERVWEKQNPDRPAYIWEIGLLNIDRQVDFGVQAAFKHVALSLDLHYNGSEFKSLGKVDSIANKKMMIYAQTRAHKLSIFKKYGFKPVLAADRNGAISPIMVSPNMVLVYMPGEEFIQKYFTGHEFVFGKKDKVEINNDEFEKAQSALHAYTSRINNLRVTIKNQQDLVREAQKVFMLYIQARVIRGERPDRERVIIDFFESYLRLVNSIPESMRHKNWQNVKTMVLDIIAKNQPCQTLFYFASSFDNIGRNQNYTLDLSGYERFLQTVPDRLELLIPSEPFLNLKFNHQGVTEKPYTGDGIHPKWY